MLKSASKKWKDFKSVIKSKHFDGNKSISENIAKGCNGRIPPKQWEWLVKYWKTEKAQIISGKNKTTRNDQANAVHTSGSRGFAVVHDQLVSFFEYPQNICKLAVYAALNLLSVSMQEIKHGRKVSRAELYCVTHTNKEGNPVDDFSADKIVSTCYFSLFCHLFQLK